MGQMQQLIDNIRLYLLRLVTHRPSQCLRHALLHPTPCRDHSCTMFSSSNSSTLQMLLPTAGIITCINFSQVRILHHHSSSTARQHPPGCIRLIVAIIITPTIHPMSGTTPPTTSKDGSIRRRGHRAPWHPLEYNLYTTKVQSLSAPTHVTIGSIPSMSNTLNVITSYKCPKHR